MHRPASIGAVRFFTLCASTLKKPELMSLGYFFFLIAQLSGTRKIVNGVLTPKRAHRTAEVFGQFGPAARAPPRDHTLARHKHLVERGARAGKYQRIEQMVC